MGLAADAAGDHLAAGDADVDLDRRIAAPKRLVDLQRRSDRALRVVGMGDWGSEHGHHAVANVLVDGPAERLHDVVNDAEEAVQERVDLLGIGPGGKLREARHVGEQHGHLTPFTLLHLRRCDG